MAANVLHDSRVHLIAPLPSLIHCSHVPPSLYARADQELVADELEGETDQDRRQGGEPWPLCRLSDRKISWNVCRGMATSASSMACMQVQPTGAVIQMPAKIARSAARPPFGLPEMPVAFHTSRLSCREAEKAPIFTPVQEPSGESKSNLLKQLLVAEAC